MKKIGILSLVLMMANLCHAQEREILISESFSQYNVGSKIAVAANNAGNYWWTTWSNAPGGAEDGVVAVWNGAKCGKFTYGNDQVLLLGDQTSGSFVCSFDMYIPNGKDAYNNILHAFAGSGSEWAAEVYYKHSSNGTMIEAGGNNYNFECPYDAWFNVKYDIDLDNDQATFFIDDVEVVTWQFSQQASGGAGTRQLAAMDFYPPTSVAVSEYYVDNIVVERVGGMSAPQFVISPSVVNRTLGESEMTTVPITINNIGNSIGDWNGWLEFGQGGAGSQSADLYYHNGEFNSGIGSSDAATREMAIRLPASAYVGAAMGMRIVSAKYYVHDNFQSTDHYYVFRVYGQGMNNQPGEMLAEKTVYSTASGTWITATFNQAVYMTGQTMWVSVQLQQGAGEYPLTMDGGEYGEEADGNWLSTNGGTFSHCYNAGSFGGAWMITANCQGTLISGTWASIDKYFGSVPGGTAETVTLSLNSIGITQGTYNANFIVETNDANMAHVVIPVTLNVNGSGNYYTITAIANPTNGGTVTGGGTYQQGQSCTISAMNNSGFTFINWTENGNVVSTNANYTFTVTGNASYVAHFQQSTTYYTITATPSPSDAGTITGAGTYTFGSICTLQAIPNNGNSFVNWIENGTLVSTNAVYSFTVTGDRNLIAVFDIVPTYYDITATASPTNGGTVTGDGSYTSGSTCNLQATPNDEYLFVKWTKNGAQVSTNPSYSFTVTGNASFVAHFQQNTNNYTITVKADPDDGGTVSGEGTYPQGSNITLQAWPNDGYSFVNWTLDGTEVSTNSNYSFTVSGNATYVAHFNEIIQEYTITASANPANGGEILGAGTYPAGSTCILSAMPTEGFVFENWSRNSIVVSTDPSYVFEVNGNADFVAHFTQDANHFTITAVADPIEGGTTSGCGTYEVGTTCTIKAVPSDGYEFSKWTLNGSQVSTNESFEFTVTANAVYVAHFAKVVNNYAITANVEPAGAGSVIGAGIFEEGTGCTLIAMPNPTYSFVSWTENGIVVSTNDHYTFTVDRERDLIAVFSQGQFYTISASAGANGTISPEGDVFVEPGEDKTFAIIPNNGCQVRTVLVDGIDLGPIPSYTFRSVNGNHSIHAEFSGLGVDDNVSLDLKIYPNPANDKINIESPNMKKVSIFNLIGVQIENKEVNDDYTIVNTNGFPQGTYILKVENNDGRIGYSRFVIAK